MLVMQNSSETSDRHNTTQLLMEQKMNLDQMQHSDQAKVAGRNSDASVSTLHQIGAAPNRAEYSARQEADLTSMRHPIMSRVSPLNLAAPKDEKIVYRDLEFHTRDLIEIRVLMHHKIEQELGQAGLWKKIMPQKIFSDLVTFIADASGHLSETLSTALERSKQALQ